MLITSRCWIWTDLNRAWDRFFFAWNKRRINLHKSANTLQRIMLQNWKRARALTHTLARSLTCLLLHTVSLSRQHANTMMLMSWVIRTDRQIDRSEKENYHSDNLRYCFSVHTICVDWRTMRWDENWLEILINHETNFYLHKQKQDQK